MSLLIVATPYDNQTADITVIKEADSTLTQDNDCVMNNDCDTTNDGDTTNDRDTTNDCDKSIDCSQMDVSQSLSWLRQVQLA